MRMWLDMGVDGLRLDAIPYLVEREGTNNENLPETHTVLKAIRAELDSSYPDRMLLAEANQWPEDTRPYFGDGEECHMGFHFPLMPRMYMALAQADRHRRLLPQDWNARPGVYGDRGRGICAAVVSGRTSDKSRARRVQGNTGHQEIRR
jgi:glycosidase